MSLWWICELRVDFISSILILPIYAKWNKYIYTPSRTHLSVWSRVTRQARMWEARLYWDRRYWSTHLLYGHWPEYVWAPHVEPILESGIYRAHYKPDRGLRYALWHSECPKVDWLSHGQGADHRRGSIYEIDSWAYTNHPERESTSDILHTQYAQSDKRDRGTYPHPHDRQYGSHTPRYHRWPTP